MKVLTGNDLKTGLVVWWDGRNWSALVDDAVDAGDQADAIIAAEQAAQRVNGAYAVDAEREARGGIRPAHIKERIRALGPTVRTDLTLKPSDPDAANWVI